MKNKETLTYKEMIQGLREKITDCRIEIEALKEEKQYVQEQGKDVREYDEWIEEQRDEIMRLHRLILSLQEVYREVR